MNDIQISITKEISRQIDKKWHQQHAADEVLIKGLRAEVFSLKKQIGSLTIALETISCSLPISEQMTLRLPRVDGQTVYRIRKKHKITATELGRILGVTPVTISRWENGKKLSAKYKRKVADINELGLKAFRKLMPDKME